MRKIPRARRIGLLGKDSWEGNFLAGIMGEDIRGFNTMSKKFRSLNEHIVYHKDGSVRAKGVMADGAPTGYWEWFRKDGTKMRSRHFENGEQVSEWVTYDRTGQKCKVTHIKLKAS